MYNEADDYKMIDRAAGVAFSNLQKPVVPAWVNKDPVTGDTKYYPIPNPVQRFVGQELAVRYAAGRGRP